MCDTDKSNDGVLEDPQRLDLTGDKAKVKRGSFKYQATVPFTYTFRFFGTVGRTSASGTMQFWGEVTFGAGDVRYCETDGKLAWSASKEPSR